MAHRDCIILVSGYNDNIEWKNNFSITWDGEKYHSQGDEISFATGYINTVYNNQSIKSSCLLGKKFFELVRKYTGEDYDFPYQKYSSTGENLLGSIIKSIYSRIQHYEHEGFGRYEYFDKTENKFIYSVNEKIKNIVLILEEPEVFLYPEWQKLIPEILEDFTKIAEIDVQFIVCTHSPFIISASSKFDHNTYLIDSGECSNKYGWNGYKAQSYVNEILGLSFNDFFKEIIICEGKGSLKDEEMYNIIFSDIGLRFISAGSCTLLSDNTKLTSYVLNKVFNKGIKLFLRDSDQLSGSLKNKEKLKYKVELNSELVFLNRTCIESYLFDHEIIKLVFPLIDSKIYKKEFEKLTKEKQFNHSKSLFQIIRIAYPDIKDSNQGIYKKLAGCINENKHLQIYKELLSLVQIK